ncbi:MAG: hypothetical protein OQK04_02955, partial [Kangiellaceae bacterium]|nr:hypothetical protein [Kangiellaceae bacterium]
NIAFANQLSSSPETVYKPLSVKIDGLEKVNLGIASFDSFVEQMQSVLKVEIVENHNVKPVHDPESPLADESGFVYKPDINMVDEMLTLNTATRAYEANIRAFNTAIEMSRKAREIGK